MVLSVCRRPPLSSSISSLLLYRGLPQMPRNSSPPRYYRSPDGGPPTPKHPASAEGAPSESRYRRMQHGAPSTYYDRHLAQGPPVRSPLGAHAEAWCPGGGAPPWSDPGPPPYPMGGRGADDPWGLMPSGLPPSAWMWGPPYPYLDGGPMLGGPADYMYSQGPPMWGAPSRGPTNWSWNTQRPRWSHHQKGSTERGSRSGLHRQAFAGVEQNNEAQTPAVAATEGDAAAGAAGDEEEAAAAAAAAASFGEGAISFQQQQQQLLLPQQQLDWEQQDFILQQVLQPEGDLSVEQQVQQQHTYMQLQQLHFQQQQLEMYWQQQRQQMQWYWQHQQQQQQQPQPQQQQQQPQQQQQQQQKVVQVIPEAAGRCWMPVLERALCEVPLVQPGPPPPAGYQTPGGPPAGAPVEEGHWRIMTFNILADSLIDDKYSKQGPPCFGKDEAAPPVAAVLSEGWGAPPGAPRPCVSLWSCMHGCMGDREWLVCSSGGGS
ncbi:hypothetical protein ACSSS7_006015 [Eimeria intestinalis]